MPKGSTRPREAPRPERAIRSVGATVTLSAPTFVGLSADEERQAVEALADLVVPLLVRSEPTDPRAPTVTGNRLA